MHIAGTGGTVTYIGEFDKLRIQWRQDEMYNYLRKGDCVPHLPDSINCLKVTKYMLKVALTKRKIEDISRCYVIPDTATWANLIASFNSA